MQDQVGRKVVVGLRQIAAAMVGRVEAGLDDTRAEAKGFLGEAVDQYADRIRGFATELARSIGYVEASADLLAARELAVRHLRTLVVSGMVPATKVVLIDGTGHIIIEDDLGGVCARINDGQGDKALLVQQALDGVEEGRRLAENDFAQRPAADAPPAVAVAPDRLTITIDGPQGSGKTVLGLALRALFPRTHRPLSASIEGTLDPRIIEMREGRPFDVTADAFVYEEASRG